MGTRSAKHKKAQREGKERDLHICQICGSEDHPEGHHIFDYSFGGAANADNIITLCSSCHAKVHAGKIDLFKF